MNKKTHLIGFFMVVSIILGTNVWGSNPNNDNYAKCDDCRSLIDSADPAALSETEISGLLLMREEEKLARDVYIYLSDIWGQRIFSNISGSEQTHMDQVALLLEAYELEDPVRNESEHGVFTNDVLAGLYRELTTRGEESLVEALAVGKAIEVLDIDDLEKLMSETDEQAILMVYENLLNGSRNHLNAFERQLDRFAS
jgi:hypothetical protein